MAAGLEQAVDFLLGARCSAAEIDWLRSQGIFTDRLIGFLENFQFSGDVDAMPEGTVLFADEPIIRVTAPIAEAQIVETRLINFLHFQTLIASKAARMVLAAPGKPLIDFGLRRAHSGEAGLLAARAAYVAGFSGTATLPAGQRFGIPVLGTMAHSFVQAQASEESAFRNFALARPDHTVFLLDTYDTELAAEKVVKIAPALARQGISVQGVRLDSGDLCAHAVKVRAILDGAGLSTVRIIASGGIDEKTLAALTAAGAPIDSYGIGTSLVTSEDHPALDCAYKLKSYGGIPRRKRSEGKAFWPGPTQVFRSVGADGRICGDTICCASQSVEGAPLTLPVVRGGELVAQHPPIGALRERVRLGLSSLPQHLKHLETEPTYPVDVSETLRALAEDTDRWISEQASATPVD